MSLRLDGKPFYALELAGIRNVHGGKITAAAYRDREKKVLLAWLDPVSGEFFTPRMEKLEPLIFPGAFLSIICANLVRWLGAPNGIAIIAGVIMMAAVFLLLLQLKRRRRSLETTLRMVVKSDYQA